MNELLVIVLAVAAAAGWLFLFLISTRLSRYRKELQRMDRSRKLLSAILGDSPAATFFIKNNKAIWASKAAEDILGWPVGKWLKEPNVSFIYPSEEEFQRMNQEVIYKDIARKERISYEYDYLHKDGHRVPTLVMLRAINRDNLDEGFIFSMIDNTEHKKAQDMFKKLSESLEQKVKERTEELQKNIEELERFRQATVDRELRMKEMKEELEQFKKVAR